MIQCRIKECNNSARFLLRRKPFAITRRKVGNTRPLFGLCLDHANEFTSKGKTFINWVFPEKLYHRVYSQGPISKSRAKKIKKEFEKQSQREIRGEV